MRQLNTIIVDDNKDFRTALKLVLSNFPNVNIIGEANNGEEYLELLKEDIPDVVFMDINMPKMDGIEATRRSISISSLIHIIGVSFHDEMDYIKEIISAGARNYIVKNNLNINILSSVLERVA